MKDVIFKVKAGRKQEDKKEPVNKIISILINVGFVAMSVFLIFNSARAFQITNVKLAILKQAQQEVTDLRIENIKLLLQKDRIETDDYVETDIRNRLNYSKSNEIVFVISELAMQEADREVERILTPPKIVEQPKETWEIWYEFFFSV